MNNKINVNISPNPSDLQTLHCSQNDTSERKFYFTMHNNGEVIDTTDISDPTFEPFDVYKGGTEQLLPVNTGVPTTSPIIADIQYPDEEKTEQEFTYRESPTTLDGKALIEKIKGNTIVWNQLIQNGNFADGVNNWVESGTTISASNGVLSVVPTGTSGTRFVYQSKNLLNGHKILYSVYLKLNKASTNSRLQFYNTQTTATLRTNNFSLTANVETFVTGIITMTSDFDRFDIQPIYSGQALTTDVFTVRNCMLFDLTAMFGSGKEPSTVEEFTSLFPLSYYQYNSGSLLSFNGTGIKIVGKNLLALPIIPFNQLYDLQPSGYFPILKGTYVLSYKANQSNRFLIKLADENGNLLSDNSYKPNPSTYWSSQYQGWFIGSDRPAGTVTEAVNITVNCYLRIGRIYGNPDTIEFTDAQLEFGSTATTYEPYTSSTTSIPTSTYFPNGMRSAGTVYDELTNSKAITRVGSVDMSTLGLLQSTGFYYRANSQDLGMAYETVKFTTTDSNIYNIYLNPNNNQLRIYVTDDSIAPTAMLQYELDTEQVTNFAQASLVCEDGESTLYQDDDLLVCDCTEDFSKDSGFKDCKIKFTNDDGVVYSNKIQLHIERKP